MTNTKSAEEGLRRIAESPTCKDLLFFEYEKAIGRASAIAQIAIDTITTLQARIAELERVAREGVKLSNIAYNYAQYDDIPERYRARLKRAADEFDEARRPAPQDSNHQSHSQEG